MRRVAIAVILSLLTAAALTTGAGLASIPSVHKALADVPILNQFISEPERGVRIHGQLTLKHFRPQIAQGCELPGAQDAAFLAYIDARSLLAEMLQLVQPSQAHASVDAWAPCRMLSMQTRKNLIVNVGETALRDCFNNNAGTECDDVIKTLKFHALGTGTNAAAETDTLLQTELTTQYNPNDTRATGSQATNGANVYRTVGTNTVDGTAAVTEWGLFNSATGGAGVLWSRVVFSVINLAASDALQTTYDCTFE